MIRGICGKCGGWIIDLDSIMVRMCVLGNVCRWFWLLM